MKIRSIKIDNLFEIFNYDISFNNNENVLIVTGPNGFGKTMLLNIIYNLFNKNFQFFQTLVFEKITILLDDGIIITISKNSDVDSRVVRFAFTRDNKKIGDFDYTDKIERKFELSISKYLPIRRVDINRWIDLSEDRILTTGELLDEYGHLVPEHTRKMIPKITSGVQDILDSIKVHLIEEQRLFRKVQRYDKRHREDKNKTIMIETIQKYADELKQLISLNSQESIKRSQELDSSYPNRLISQNDKVSEEDYNIRFNELKEIQKKLKRNGLYESKLEVLKYSEADSKALLVYLHDLEIKLGVFDNLLGKLELFTNILNKRRFTYKTIQIDRDQGFYFKTDNGKQLELTQLSSGEQHETVLLFDLIFNTKQNVLVLIDEPEISLHVSWQKEFLNDLLRIIEIQNIQVVIATHSPSIINDRWDLVYNLEKVDV